jgi:hypothetical protein
MKSGNSIVHLSEHKYVYVKSDFIRFIDFPLVKSTLYTYISKIPNGLLGFFDFKKYLSTSIIS